MREEELRGGEGTRAEDAAMLLLLATSAAVSSVSRRRAAGVAERAIVDRAAACSSLSDSNASESMYSVRESGRSCCCRCCFDGDSLVDETRARRCASESRWSARSGAAWAIPASSAATIDAEAATPGVPSASVGVCKSSVRACRRTIGIRMGPAREATDTEAEAWRERQTCALCSCVPRHCLPPVCLLCALFLPVV